jgi:hypothetical protein
MNNVRCRAKACKEVPNDKPVSLNAMYSDSSYVRLPDTHTFPSNICNTHASKDAGIHACQKANTKRTCSGMYAETDERAYSH